MKGSASSPRAEELLIERALRPLDESEQWELEHLNALDEDGFDRAAAAIVIATSAAESLPQHLADKILAAAPQPAALPQDFKRTLPGVVVQPPEAGGLPRDTMVGVDIGSVATELAGMQDEQAETVLNALPHATLPPPTADRRPARQTNDPTVAMPMSPPRSDPSSPGPDSADPAAKPRVTASTVKQSPRQTAERSISTVVQRPTGHPAPTPKPVEVRPVRPTARPMPMPMPIASPDPFPQSVQPVPAERVSRGLPLPQQTLAPGEAPPIVTPIIDLSARRSQHTPIVKRRTSIVPWLAAAACLLLAGGAVLWSLQRDPNRAPTVAVPVATPASERAALFASATDLSKITWTPTQDATARGATGDVVWSQAKQRGFMRFVGLTPNDPKQFQYQLWIFDGSRDQAFPVDGGVFDVTSTGEVIVPISAKLAVNDATLFAVTIEKPGGVVVSKRERIVVTASRS